MSRHPFLRPLRLAGLLAMVACAAGPAQASGVATDLFREAGYAARQVRVAGRAADPPLGRLAALGFAVDTLAGLLEVPEPSGPVLARVEEVFAAIDRTWTEDLAVRLAPEGLSGLSIAGAREEPPGEASTGGLRIASPGDLDRIEAGVLHVWVAEGPGRTAGPDRTGSLAPLRAIRVLPVLRVDLVEDPASGETVASPVAAYRSLGGGPTGGLLRRIRVSPAGADRAGAGDAWLVEGSTPGVRAFLVRRLGLPESSVVAAAGLELGALRPALARRRPDLDFAPWPVRPVPAALSAGAGDELFAALEAGPLLLHYPHDRFDGVENLLAGILEDPATREVSLSLEHAEDDSAFLGILARGGATVRRRVLLETRSHPKVARWAGRLREAGADVIQPDGPRVHGKLLLVRRDAGAGPAGLVLIHTGNFHRAQTTYLTDLALVTTHPALVAELGARLAAQLDRSAPPPARFVRSSPGDLREAWLAAIREEPVGGTVVCLGEQLTDPEVLEALGAAAARGVEVHAVVRSVTHLAPGPGITVHSMVGRFLEHTRLLVTSRRVLFGSADPTAANFDRMVDHVLDLPRDLFPAEHQFLWALAHLYLADTHGRFVLTDAGQDRWEPATAPATDRVLHPAVGAGGGVDVHELLAGAGSAREIEAWVRAPR